jgi:iron complex outermembrane receptor protein
VDLSGNYTRDIGRAGALSVDTIVTWVHRYDLQESPGSPVIHAVGRRNFVNPAFGAPQPEYRGNATLGWSRGSHNASATIRYTDHFENDQNPASPAGSFTTVDAQYSYALTGWLGTNTLITVGGINVFNRDPPLLQGDSLGYDGRIHDGRRRVLFLRFTQSF